MLSKCLDGDDLFSTQQSMLYRSLTKTLSLLNDMAQVSSVSPAIVPLLDAAGFIIQAIIPDKNYLGFAYYLYHIYVIGMKKAETASAVSAFDYLETIQFSPV